MKTEENIFQTECPVPLREVEKLSHIILMQLLPALFEEDMAVFGSSINAIQELASRKRKLRLRPFKCIMKILREEGAYGAGMSSFGPTVYAFGKMQRS